MKSELSCFSVVLNSRDADLQDWLQAQENKSRSVKVLIRHAIAQYGNIDIIDLLTANTNLYSNMNTAAKSGSKRGRPRKIDSDIQSNIKDTTQNIDVALSVSEEMKLSETESIQSQTETNIISSNNVISEDISYEDITNEDTTNEDTTSEDIDFSRYL